MIAASNPQVQVHKEVTTLKRDESKVVGQGHSGLFTGACISGGTFNVEININQMNGPVMKRRRPVIFDSDSD